ncbi:phosphoenolpyruvate carboxylase [Caulobacter sp. S45]|uniref:phosphoenolpyruvate carboxylase n=1 Tax=Caulobacter sp. S45 TaxID=1641861 RepID=UPI00157521A5|nr:phosphoenolpyruvate carboxylase [Caulobacter sp. S45]
MADDHLPTADSVQTSMLGADLAQRLTQAKARAASDPFTSAALLFALDLSREIEGGETPLNALEAVVSQLTAQAFTARAERLGRYLGDCSPEHLRARLDAFFQAIAARGDFEAYAKAVEAAPFGVVLTAHPTFALNHDLSIALVELATGRTMGGEPLTEEDRAGRLTLAEQHPHGPPAELSLDVEHAWSLEALHSAHTALEIVYGSALNVAQRRWPTLWTQLSPRLITLATWVGFDQDGRTDVTWQVSIGKRLQLKLAALERRRTTLRSLLEGAEGDWRSALTLVDDLLKRALETTSGQLAALDGAGDDPATLPAFARTMVAGRPQALVEPAPLLRRIEDALKAAPDDQSGRTLLILRAGIATEGVSLAGIHVRLNSGQLHNAIRRDVNLQGSPTDPANRRTYFSAIDALIGEATPVEINFGDLAHEPASARRLMMTVAQMRKYVDASTPVRFLIAETETGFTLLTALYFARLFGVEDHVEISPLFETEEAFERGEKVVEEALRSRHFRDYLVRQGRLAIEFGFSDSGRFIGQLAATFRIERLRLRLAEMMREEGLSGLEIVFFNTHGESVGRGGHPGGLGDRFRYAAPPRSRAEFARLGIRVKEEDAFQGGEGYLPLMIPAAALATVTTALETVLLDDPEAEADPIYDDPDFATEFFATCEQDFASLVADPDYAALVGLFATHLLPKTGSRPVQRQSGDGGRPQTLASVSELRAIPNNGILQQLGYLANSLFGLGRAAGKNRATFELMRERSPRFRRALALAESAAAASDLTVLEAYAASLQPALWLARAAAAEAPGCDLELAGVVEGTGLSEHLQRVDRRLKAEDVRIRAAGVRTTQGGRLELLHAIRIALIQASDRLAVQVPDFNPRGEITLAVIQQRLLRLDVPASVELLRQFFPLHGEPPSDADFGESSSYAAAGAQGYRRETEQVFEPLERLFGLLLKISHAVSHETGACG